MNLKEFAALKIGDQIRNDMQTAGGIGTVTETKPDGVRVRWGEDTPGAVTFFYSVNSTSWFGWTKTEPAVGPELDAELDRFVADRPKDIMT